MPSADRLLTADQLERPEPRYPLALVFCHDCGLAQIDHTVDPAELFCNDYPYFSSVSDALQVHTRANVVELIERRKLGPDSLVVELASNDGYLLKHYKSEGIRVLGIDPAEPPAKAAQAIGIETIIDFFTTRPRLGPGAGAGLRQTSCMPTTCSRTWRTRTGSSKASPGC